MRNLPSDELVTCTMSTVFLQLVGLRDFLVDGVRLDVFGHSLVVRGIEHGDVLDVGVVIYKELDDLKCGSIVQRSQLGQLRNSIVGIPHDDSGSHEVTAMHNSVVDNGNIGPGVDAGEFGVFEEEVENVLEGGNLAVDRVVEFLSFADFFAAADVLHIWGRGGNAIDLHFSQLLGLLALEGLVNGDLDRAGPRIAGKDDFRHIGRM